MDTILIERCASTTPVIRFPDDHFALASCPHVVLLINFCKFWPLQKGSHNPQKCSLGHQGPSCQDPTPISSCLYRYDGLRYGSYVFAMIVGTISDPKAVAATGHDFFESSKQKKYLTDQVAPLEVYCRISNRKSPCAPPRICLSGSDLSKEPPRQDSWCFCAFEGGKGWKRMEKVGQSATPQKIHMEHNSLKVWFRSNFPFLNHWWWLVWVSFAVHRLQGDTVLLGDYSKIVVPKKGFWVNPLLCHLTASISICWKHSVNAMPAMQNKHQPQRQFFKTLQHA